MPISRHDDKQHQRHRRQRHAQVGSARVQNRRLVGLHGKPRSTRCQEHRQTQKAREQRERRHQAQQRDARIVAVGIHGNARVNVAHRNAEQKRRQKRAEEQADIPRLAPLGVMCAELKRDRANDKPEQHQHDGQVEARERSGVRHRERREQRATCREQPHLVTIPHRTHATANNGLFAFALRDERIQDACAQVESVKHEVAGDQHEDKEEPQALENGHLHDYSPSFATAAAGTAVSPSSGPFLMKWAMIRT